MQFNLNDMLTFEPTEAGLAIMRSPECFAHQIEETDLYQMQA